MTTFTVLEVIVQDSKSLKIIKKGPTCLNVKKYIRQG